MLQSRLPICDGAAAQRGVMLAGCRLHAVTSFRSSGSGGPDGVEGGTGEPVVEDSRWSVQPGWAFATGFLLVVANETAMSWPDCRPPEDAASENGIP